MPQANPVISRHRLPQPYRGALIALWLTPIALLLVTIIIGTGANPALFDPRFILAVAVMGIPAYYIWQEGVDVLPDGLRVRIRLGGTYTFHELSDWHLGTISGSDFLSVWDWRKQRVLGCPSAHLTEFPTLLTTLKTRINRDPIMLV